MQTMSNRGAASALLRFSVPLILSGILQRLYVWADAAIVGRFVGEDALAAIGLTGTVSECISLLMIGFTTGLSVIAAQRHGAGDDAAVRGLFSGFLVLLSSAFLAVAAAGVALSGNLLRALNTPQAIYDSANGYLRIVLMGVPFLSVYNLYEAMLRAVGDTRPAFFAVILSSVANVALDLWLVAGLRLGVRGAAVATILSQIAMTVYLSAYAARKYALFRPARGANPVRRGAVALGCRYGLPLMFQQSVTAAGNLILQGFMNGFGAHTVAAITSAYRVDSVMLLPLFNFGAAISTMVAQSKGAGDGARLRRFAKTGTAMCMAASVAIMLAMFNFGGSLVGIFGVGREAARIGGQFFRSISVYYLGFGLVSALRGVVEGDGGVVYSTATGIAALAVRIALSHALAPSLGNMAIAHAEGLHWLFMIACFLPYYLKRVRR